MKSLSSSLKFLEVVDKLKDTYRKCLTMSGSREENTAEHSFSLIMAVVLFEKRANHNIDILKTMKMALFHDVVEVYSGDTFHYDKEKTDKFSEEFESLKKILSHLDDDELVSEITSLWNEFEEGDSPEALFLRGLDRFLPMYHNYRTKGHSWIKYGITKEQALEKNSHIENASSEIWEYTKEMLKDSKMKGWIN